MSHECERTIPPKRGERRTVGDKCSERTFSDGRLRMRGREDMRTDDDEGKGQVASRSFGVSVFCSRLIIDAIDHVCMHACVDITGRCRLV
jgi:hypothetical protein